MSDILTSIRVPGVFCSGVADWGEKTAEEMIAYVRDYAQQQVDLHQKILDTQDDQFEIEVYRGPIARKHIKWLQDPDREGRERRMAERKAVARGEAA